MTLGAFFLPAKFSCVLVFACERWPASLIL
uniref:GLNA5 n=1 Tax=Arundo donax TaxID=35708 RepID=A0A0A8YKV7_ARUDO